MDSDEAAVLEEAQKILQEATQRIRLVRNLLRTGGVEDSPDYRELTHRVRSALAMTEAAYLEARRKAREPGSLH